MAEKEIILNVKVQTNTEAAIKQIMELNTQIEREKNLQKEYNQWLKEGTVSWEEYNREMELSRTRTTQYSTKVRELRKEVQNNIKTEKELQGSLTQLRAALSNLTAQYDKLSQAERESAKGQQLQTKIKAITEQLKGAEEETGRFYRNVGNYEEAIKNAIVPTNGLSSTLFELAQGGESAGTKIKAFSKAVLSLAKNPYFLAVAGVTGVGVAFKWWYNYNEGLVKATRLTKQFTGLAGEELKSVRNEVQILSDTFEGSFNETLIAANTLARQFGITVKEALDLIKEGYIAGADITGDFLGNVKEFSTFFKEAGLQADEFIAILAQSTKDGVFSNKGIDAIKEATIRLREMTTATSDALAGIGIDSKQVQKDLVSGSKTMFQVIQEISARLSQLPPQSAEVGAAIADVFGSPGEDAGLRYIATLKDINTNLETVMESAGELGELQREQLESEQELQDAVSKFLDLTGGTFERLTTKIKVLWNDILTFFVESFNSWVEKWQRRINFVGGLIDGIKKKFGIEVEEKVQTSSTSAQTTTTASVTATTKSTGTKSSGETEEERKAREARIKALKEQAKKELAIMRALEDSENKLIKDSVEQQRATINTSYDRQIEDLRARLENEKDLTGKSREAINQTIANLEKQREQELANVTEEAARQKLEQEAAFIEKRLQLATEGSEQEYNLKVEQLDKQKELELSNAQLTADEKLLIEQKYQKDLENLTSEYNRQKQEKAMQEFELELSNRLAQAKLSGEEELQVELENAKARLDAVQQLEGESDAEFKARQLAAQQQYVDAKEALAQKEIEIEQTKFEAAAQITGALSGLFEQLGESNKAFAVLSKTLALAEIAINTGKAIAAGIAQSQSVPFPGNIAAIATTVATVLANITTAISTVNSAKFATGGLVEGPGTGTSDSIPAMLSNGESVMTARATSMFAPLLSAINVAGGGVPIQVREKSSQALGEEMIARAIARGMQDVHPIVSVTEINKVGSQVKVVENLGSI